MRVDIDTKDWFMSAVMFGTSVGVVSLDMVGRLGAVGAEVVIAVDAGTKMITVDPGTAGPLMQLMWQRGL